MIRGTWLEEEGLEERRQGAGGFVSKRPLGALSPQRILAGNETCGQLQKILLSEISIRTKRRKLFFPSTLFSVGRRK